MEVVVVTGDGSAYGMGLSATSGAMDRISILFTCVMTMKVMEIQASNFQQLHRMQQSLRPAPVLMVILVLKKICFPSGRRMILFMWRRLSVQSR